MFKLVQINSNNIPINWNNSNHFQSVNYSINKELAINQLLFINIILSNSLKIVTLLIFQVQEVLMMPKYAIFLQLILSKYNHLFLIFFFGSVESIDSALQQIILSNRYYIIKNIIKYAIKKIWRKTYSKTFRKNFPPQNIWT